MTVEAMFRGPVFAELEQVRAQRDQLKAENERLRDRIGKLRTIEMRVEVLAELWRAGKVRHSAELPKALALFDGEFAKLGPLLDEQVKADVEDSEKRAADAAATKEGK